MKMDKTGACTVIAAIATVAQLAPGTPLLAVAPAVENMPGPHSTRPGDIVTALNGKTVDITNTDAEGRLILGDAMTYAERLGATHIVDIATLTGAVGAGARPAGDRRVRHARRAGTTRSWPRRRAPASGTGSSRSIDEYGADMDSWYGDMMNSGHAPRARSIKSAHVPARVRHPAVGPPRHRGTAYFRKAHPWAPRGADRRRPRDARGAGAGRRPAD